MLPATTFEAAGRGFDSLQARHPTRVLRHFWAPHRVQRVCPGLDAPRHEAFPSPCLDGADEIDPRKQVPVVKAIPGVVDRGFFLDLVVEVAVGSPSGVRFL